MEVLDTIGDIQEPSGTHVSRKARKGHQHTIKHLVAMLRLIGSKLLS